MVNFYGCYKFNKEWLLIELSLNIASSEIDWDAISAPNNELEEDYWQCPYMEQYLNEDGTEKICETYDEPQFFFISDNIFFTKFFIRKSPIQPFVRTKQK